MVLARKFNDIFYSISTPEWKIFNRHVLVIFANDIFEKYIPFRELFDDIIVFDSPKRRINGINVIREIRARKDALECEAVILSNIVLVANQYLINISRCRYIFLLEDGLITIQYANQGGELVVVNKIYSEDYKFKSPFFATSYERDYNIFPQDYPPEA